MTRYVRDVLAVPLCLWNTSRAKKEELLPSECIRVPFVSAVNNIADFFTKALPEKTFVAMRNRIMNVPRDDGIVSTGGRCKEVAGARAAAADPDSIMSTLGHA